MYTEALQIDLLYKSNRPGYFPHIVGLVQTDTLEFQLGARFFSDDGIFYTENGMFVPKAHYATFDGDLSITGLMSFSDLPETIGRRFRVDDRDLHTYYQKVKPFVVHDGRVEVGKTFVDRMGFLVTIDIGAPSQGGKELLNFWSTYSQPRIIYRSDGLSYPVGNGNILSMYDLVGEYQPIRQ